MINGLGGEDGANQNATPGHVDISPISGSELSGDFVLKVLKIGPRETVNTQR